MSEAHLKGTRLALLLLQSRIRVCDDFHTKSTLKEKGKKAAAILPMHPGINSYRQGDRHIS